MRLVHNYRSQLVFSLAVGIALVSGVRAEAQSVSISNPGFESGFTGWTQVSPVSLSSVTHSGSDSAKFTSSPGGVKRTLTGLAPSTTYALSAWVLGVGKIGARNFGGTEVSTTWSASSWTQKTVTFTTGASSTSVEIYAAYTSGTGRVDDFAMTVSSSSPTPPPPSSTATNITPPGTSVTASTSDANLPANAVDGSLSTRWSGYGDGAWLQLDLGSVSTLSYVKVAVYNGTSRRNSFDIKVSTDGTTWTTASGGLWSSGTTNSLETYDFADVSARYVRYVGHGYVTSTGSGQWNSVTEIQAWGTAGSVTPPPPPPPPPSTGGTGCTYPAQVLDLTNWKLTLPINNAEEIKQPALATFALDPYFVVNGTCTGIQFRAPTNGSTTSGSSYPRSELREMTSSGTANASWSSTSGTHEMFIDQAITAVPAGKKHIVAGQIHDANNDVIVIRLEYPKLYIDMNGTTGPTLDANYTLGKRFTVDFLVSGGKIQIFYNGSTTPAITYTKSDTGLYFKAGAYTQSNCSTESSYGATCSSSDYGEVNIYDVWVDHR